MDASSADFSVTSIIHININSSLTQTSLFPIFPVFSQGLLKLYIKMGVGPAVFFFCGAAAEVGVREWR